MIKIKGGSICFYGDWFGRPYDNFHSIKNTKYENEILEIEFDGNIRLTVENPEGIRNTEKEFTVNHAKKIVWGYNPYGYKQAKIREIVYEMIDNKLTKTDHGIKKHIQIKEPFFAVYLA